VIVAMQDRHIVRRDAGAGGLEPMEELTVTTPYSNRRKVWVNATILLFLLAGVLLGITQLFVVLVVYCLVIVPA
jgi:hypothetical protein